MKVSILSAALPMFVCGCACDFLPTLNLPSTAVTLTTWLHGSSSDAGRRMGASLVHKMKGAAALAASVWSISMVPTCQIMEDRAHALAIGCTWTSKLGFSGVHACTLAHAPRPADETTN